MYVLGFLFDRSLTKVLLVDKRRGPRTALGWNGIGGHVNDGETPEHAMTRECLEETRIMFQGWRCIDFLQRPLGNVHVFTASFAIEAYSYAEINGETPTVVHISDVLKRGRIQLAEDVPWLVTKALERLRQERHSAEFSDG